MNVFKSIGSNGSGNHGLEVPPAIESHLEIKGLLKTLETLRVGSSQGAHLSPNPSVRSQFSNASSADEHDSVSQAVFATQAPLFPKPAVRNSISGAPVKQLQAGLMSAQTQALGTDARYKHTFSETEAPEDSPLDPGRVHSEKPIVNGEKDLARARAALLGFVQQGQSKPHSKPVSHPTTKDTAVVTHSADPSIADQGPGRLENPKSSPIAFASNSAQISSLKEAAVSLSEPVDSVPAPSVTELNQSPSRNRIHSKDVRIPKDQELLLDSEGCKSWRSS